MRDIFSHKKISDNLYIIYERYCEEKGLTLGLVVGTEKALLIDSGLGAVDTLREYVEKITDKPIICVPTHGHPDHAGGAALFDEVYMSSKDDEEIKWGLTKERRLSDLVDFSNNDVEILDYAKEHTVDTSSFSYKELKDDMVFNLGGEIIHVLPMPGHTNGSVALYNEEEQYFFTGDAVSETLMLTGYDIKYMQESHKCLKKMVETAEKMKNPVVWAAHYPNPVPLSMAIDLRDCCQEILDGNIQQDERTHFKFAEMNDPDIVLFRHDHNQVSVVYNQVILKQI